MARPPDPSPDAPPPPEWVPGASDKTAGWAGQYDEDYPHGVTSCRTCTPDRLIDLTVPDEWMRWAHDHGLTAHTGPARPAYGPEGEPVTWVAA